MGNIVNVKHITEEDYISLEEKFRNDPETKNYSFGKNYYGVFYNDKLVGLMGLEKWYPDNLTITMAILKEYRGKGIAGIAINKIVDVFGKEFPEIRRFICNISPDNTSSIKAVEKIKWPQTYEFDEAMYNESGEFFYMYYRENPYYNIDNKPKLS